MQRRTVRRPHAAAACRRTASGRSHRDASPATTRYREAMLRYRPGVALIVVDVQNDFADPGQPQRGGRRGRHPGPSTSRSISARQRRALVFATQDWHPEPRRISPRTAASTLITASRTRGAPSSGPRAARRRDVVRGDQRRGRGARPSRCAMRRPTGRSPPSSALLKAAGDEVAVTASRPTIACGRPRWTPQPRLPHVPADRRRRRRQPSSRATAMRRSPR